MRGARGLLGAVLCLAAAPVVAGAAEDPPPAFLEVEAEPREPFEGQAVAVTFRVGFDPAFFRERAVPISLRSLDLPVRIEAPWLGRLTGAEEGVAGTTLAFGDGVVAAVPAGETERDGRRFRLLEVRRTFLPSGPGEVGLAAATLRYAHASRFGGNALGERVPLDRAEGTAEAAPPRIRVRPLPEEGRPPGFSGAVGRFTVEAEASAEEVAAGEGLRLVLRIEGEGNLDALEPPRLDPLEGFHVLGRIDGRAPGRRTVTWEVAPVDGSVDRIPPIRLPYFDPGPPPSYRVAETDPIPLRVRPGPGGTRRTVPEAPAGAGPGEGGGGAAPWALAAAILLLGGIAILLARRGRAPGRAAPDPGGERAAAAAAAFRERAASGDADLAGPFAEVLAARLRCPPAAVVSPDLPARLGAAGVPPGTAARAATLLERLGAARYGGAPAGPDAAAEAAALLEELGGPGPP